jgi:hypothetical protein
MPHAARLHGRRLFLRSVAAGVAAIGVSALPTAPMPAVAASANSTAAFAAITCPTATTCFAAGTWGDAQHKYVQPLVGRLAGGKWILTRAPTPAVANGHSGRGSLEGIACATPRRCFAVGNYDVDYGQSVNRRTLIEQWDGTRWTLASRLRPPNSNTSVLTGVDCVSATKCFAVGDWHEIQSRWIQVLLAQWDGKTWSMLRAAHAPPKALDSKLRSISCGSATSCFAVGTYQLSHHPGQTLTERWDGERWAVVASPNAPAPYDSVDYLEAVSCASPASCLAVGSASTPGYDGRYQTLSLRWTGARWIFVSTPYPPSRTAYILNAAACTASNACFSVGNRIYYTTDGYPQPHAHVERWDGKTWAVANTGLASTRPLSAINCRSGTDCIAVGGGPAPVVAHWNGAAWSAESVPVVPGPA